MRNRLLVTAGWVGAAVVAVLVGLLGINWIGAGLTSGSDQPPLTPAEVSRQLADLPPSSSPAPSAPPAAPESPAPAPAASSPEVRTFTTAGGTVTARCDPADPAEGLIVTMSPRQGFALHERDDDDGEFRSLADARQRVEVEASCAGGVVAVTEQSTVEDD